MSRRKWTRNHSRLLFLPEELLVAGLDFEVPEDDPLRDEPSESRGAGDDELLQSLRSRGFQSVIMVTSRIFGREVKPVVLDGRRRVRLSRVVNQERLDQGLKVWKWTAEYRPVEGVTALEVARILNRGQQPETTAQTARYLVRLMNMGHDQDSAAQVLGVRPGSISQLRDVGDPSCPDWVYEALDREDMSLQAAASIARKTPEEQERVRELLSGRRTTTSVVRSAVARASGGRAVVAPKKRRVRALLAREDAQLPDDFRRGVLFMLGELAPEDVPELADYWKED